MIQFNDVRNQLFITFIKFNYLIFIKLVTSICKADRNDIKCNFVKIMFTTC